MELSEIRDSPAPQTKTLLLLSIIGSLTSRHLQNLIPPSIPLPSRLGDAPAEWIAGSRPAMTERGRRRKYDFYLDNGKNSSMVIPPSPIPRKCARTVGAWG